MTGILVEVRDFMFSKSVQRGAGAHPALYIRYGATLLGVKRPGGGIGHPLASSAHAKETVEL